MRQDEQQKLHPSLASSWENDGKNRWTFKLRDGMSWPEYRDIMKQIVTSGAPRYAITWHGEAVTKLPAIKTLARLRRAFRAHRDHIAAHVDRMAVLISNQAWATILDGFLSTTGVPYSITVVDA